MEWGLGFELRLGVVVEVGCKRLGVGVGLGFGWGLGLEVGVGVGVGVGYFLEGKSILKEVFFKNLIY